MTQFSRFSALWASFYSPDLYRDVVYRWKGIGVLYLLLLLAITWIPSPIRWHFAARGLTAADSQAFIDQLPAITIQDGVMSATPPGRHVIRLADGENDEGLLIIDDTAETVPSDLTTQAFVLTRREAGVIRPSRNERRVWTLTPAADMSVTRDDVWSFLNSLAFWVPPLGYIGGVAGSLVFRVLQSLIYGALAMALAKRKGVTLEYGSAIRLAALAVTPVIVMRTLIWFGPSEPAWYVRWPIAIAVACAYIAFGVRALADMPSDAATRAPDARSLRT
jgi:hypothetical protein